MDGGGWVLDMGYRSCVVSFCLLVGWSIHLMVDSGPFGLYMHDEINLPPLQPPHLVEHKRRHHPRAPQRGDELEFGRRGQALALEGSLVEQQPPRVDGRLEGEPAACVVCVCGFFWGGRWDV